MKLLSEEGLLIGSAAFVMQTCSSQDTFNTFGVKTGCESVDMKRTVAQRC